jgi:multidrug efflux pump subunit AcrB
MIMILAALFLGGIVSFFSMPINRLPEIIIPRLMVETFYSGMGAAEIRSSLTIPLEDALSPVKGLEEIRSISRDGASLVILSFRWGTDTASAAALVREAIDTVYPALPAGAGKPAVITGDPDEEPHALIAVRSPAGDNVFSRHLAEYEFRSRLRRLDGAGGIILTGGEKEEIRISTDAERSAIRGYNGNDLARIISLETADIPGGSAREGSREITVISSGRPKQIEELASLVLPASSGSLKLADIASTYRGKAPKKSVFIFQNEEQTSLEVLRCPGADPVKLSRDIKKAIKEINEIFSGDIECVLVYDASSSILESVVNLVISAVLGAAAVALILFFFMGRSVRRLHSGILAAFAIPVSAAAAMIVLCFSGRSLNSMSLAGIALGIGIVSDCSVVVLDMLRKKTNNAEETAALTASISGSSFTGTLTTIIVFIPIVFLPGPLGSLFGDLAAALVSSVIMGWLYSQFFLPSLFVLFPKGNDGEEKMRMAQKYYRPLLKTALRHSSFLTTVVVISSLAGITLLLSRPLIFVSPEAVREIEITIDFPAGTLPDAASTEAIRISEYLSELPQVSFLSGRMGAEEEDTSRRCDPAYRKEKFVFRCFLNRGTKPSQALREIQTALAAEDRFPVSASYPMEKSAKILGLSSIMSLAVKGTDRQDTALRSKAAAETIRTNAGTALASLNMRPSGTRPELRLIPNREAFAFLGISAAGIADAVYAATEGIVAGDMEINGKTLDIRVAGESSKLSQSGLEKLPIALSSAGGNRQAPIYLDSVNKIEWRESEAAFTRQDRADVVYLDLLPAAGKEKELSGILMKLPSGFSRADESAFTRYRSSLIASMILVIILLYLCMAAQFESFILPFIFMISIPFSLAGAGPFLFISGLPADSGSILGLIVLFGLAVNNGLILYEVIEGKIVSGLSPLIAVLSGSIIRFRPVLITSLTTIVALAPLALIPGSSQRSMALTMLGGLCASTALTFIFMPPVFIALMQYREKRNGR